MKNINIARFLSIKALAVLALISIPMVLVADSVDTLDANKFVRVGNYYSSSGGQLYCTYGLLIVGQNVNVPQYSYNHDSVIAGRDLNLYDGNSMIFGRGNKGTSEDQLFIVGNGTPSYPENEFEILKNGVIRIGADSNSTSDFALEIDSDEQVITIAPQGDISMGQYDGS